MLAGIDVFRELGRDERADIACRCKAHRYAASELVMAVDDPGRDVLFVVVATARRIRGDTGPIHLNTTRSAPQ